MPPGSQPGDSRNGAPGAPPLIGVTACRITVDDHPSHRVGHKYVAGVVDGAGGMPVLIATIGDDARNGGYDLARLVDRLDGLFLTGGRANVEPHHYGGPAFPDDEYCDSARDNTVLPLIRACIERAVPVFGVCRGHQEINVALGGSLHYRVHLVEGKLDHRMPTEGDMDTRFGLAHDLTLAAEGAFAGLIGDTAIRVNSAHGQGIDRLAPGLTVEAMAPDGIIEGISVPDCDTFAVGVQWHAEHRWAEHRLSNELFKAFGRAARQRTATRG